MRDHKGISRAEDTREKHSSVTDDNRKKQMRRRYINVKAGQRNVKMAFLHRTFNFQSSIGP